MKLRNLSIILAISLVFLAHAEIAFGQSRTNQLIRRCPVSATNATVSLDTRGNIVLTPCATRTVTIGGTTATTFGGVILGPNGTATAPTFGFTNSSTTGFFRSAANAIGVSTNGVERWTFGATGTLTSAQGTLTTTAVPWLSHTATWNDGGTTHRGIFSNVTNTASGANSTLIDLQVGGQSRFSVTAGGTGKFGNVDSTFDLQIFPSQSNTGVFQVGENGNLGGTNPSFKLTEATDRADLAAGTISIKAGGAADPSFTLTESTNTLALNATTVNVNGERASRGLVSYLASTVTYNNTDTLANTPLSVTVAAGGIYDIEAVLFSTNTVTIGRALLVDFDGTATFTNVVGEWRATGNSGGILTDGGIFVTALSTDQSAGDADGAASGHSYQFKGTVEVNAGGTLVVRGAQRIAAENNTALLRGSFLKLTRLN